MANILYFSLFTFLFNIYVLGPPFKEPSAKTDIEESSTSSIRYNNLNEGNAIKIKITAGVIVHINSISVKIFILSYKNGLYNLPVKIFLVT